MKKINIIMPTYNDADSITETLNTIKAQTYKDWILTIVNDGSVDNTEKVIQEYIKNNKLEKKIKYIYQKNSDQLNAIKNALNYIDDKESLVYILHSDDLLNNESVFEKAVNYFNVNPEVDSIIADYPIIDKNSCITGFQKVKRYNKTTSTIALQGLWLGRNLYIDFAFHKYEIFKKYVYESYLTWNRPFWLTLQEEKQLLNVKKVDFPFFKYRVYEGNYINNEIGLLNVLNGELRTALSIFKQINIPLYKTQYFIFRIFNKLHIPYKTIYTKKQSKNIYSKIKFIINKRISDENIEKYIYFSAILKFFKRINNERKIKIMDVKKKDVFLGSDVRTFNKKMLNKELPDIYYILFKEMKKGFKTIKTEKKSYNNLITILKFLDIYDYVKIEISN